MRRHAMELGRRVTRPRSKRRVRAGFFLETRKMELFLWDSGPCPAQFSIDAPESVVDQGHAFIKPIEGDEGTHARPLVLSQKNLVERPEP